MAVAKGLLKRSWTQATLAWLAARYIWLVWRTTRWRYELPPETADLLTGKRAAVFCFWHGRLAVMRAAWRGGDTERFHMLISGHRDGAFIARAMRGLGMSVITGSGSKPQSGGSEALREMREVLARGHVVGVTPDGPRGPLMRAKGGAVMVAQATGAPLVAVSGAVRRGRLLGSWDRFLLAWPCNRGVLLFGRPIAVPEVARLEELEEARRRLEDDLIALTAEADRRCGRQPVPPAQDLGRRPKSRKRVRKKPAVARP
jgi:lysophospholipid acyltransferase (LPLAT)-like uncharacterized protein